MGRVALGNYFPGSILAQKFITNEHGWHTRGNHFVLREIDYEAILYCRWHRLGKIFMGSINGIVFVHGIACDALDDNRVSG